MIARDYLPRALAFVLIAALCCVPGSALAHDRKAGPASTSIDDYLTRVRAAGSDQPTTTGSLWVSSGILANVSSDYKARSMGDLIIVQLVDTFSAATNGENQSSRQFNTKSAITGLLGAVNANSSLQHLFDANSATALDGKGASTMSSNLQMSLAGRVVEVMPNGVLVVEATRDFTIGNDRQTVILHGLVRPGDISTGNAVLSSQISALELQIRGKGAVADASRNPNLVIRTLLKIFSF